MGGLSGFKTGRRSRFESPRATRIKVGFSSFEISRASANNPASCLDGLRSPDSILRRAKTEQPARSASSYWVRSSILRRCLSHSPNKTGVSNSQTFAVGFSVPEKIQIVTQFANKSYLLYFAGIVAHFG